MAKNKNVPFYVTPILCALAFIVVITLYALFAPFTLVFKADSEEVYRQDSVSVLTNFEKDAARDAESDVVYGAEALDFRFKSKKGYRVYTSAYKEVKGEMVKRSLVNLLTLKWGEENFEIVIETVNK